MHDHILQRFLAATSPVRKKIVTMRLFGSRATGEERPDSDYDLCLVVSEDFSPADKDVLYDIVMDILLDTGRLVSLKIFRQQAFERLRSLQTPFIQHVLTQGIAIG